MVFAPPRSSSVLGFGQHDGPVGGAAAAGALVASAREAARASALDALCASPEGRSLVEQWVGERMVWEGSEAPGALKCGKG